MARTRKLRLRHVLAANVRRERLARGLSQEELGDAAGLSQNYISRIESALPATSIDSIEQLAIALAINASDLLVAPGNGG